MNCNNRYFLSKFNGYKHFNHRRISSSGGMVLYVREEIGVSVLNADTIVWGDIFIVLIKIQIKLMLKNFQLFDFFLNICFQKLKVFYRDFNFPNVNFKEEACDNERLRLNKLLNNNYLYQIIRQTTRLNNILDLLITNKENF